ncbi:hypothetical protein GH714_006780 [Hevea brasiliensis]|uniref:R13L1/DRL21-like LRR repeat region domain-containing protein n=1 Tax=Hevea brasiliensis TaxID=3981 RepID=A0A6A6LK47_HEVBR|nr:hypothetical protein GH714_006780 [Hevea brasiliensis]
MPSQMGRLTKLQSLSDFFIGERNGSSPKELGKLQYLEGELSIHNFQNVVDVEDASESNLKDWLGDSSFSTLAKLKLYGSRYCSSLPSLRQLASLKELDMVSFYGVPTLGHEVYGNCTSNEKPFQSLERLWIMLMPQWHEWIPCAGAFPRL